MSEIVIRRVTKADAEALWALRLEALKTNPEAFGADYETTRKMHNATSYAEGRIPDDDRDDVIFCAALDGELVGMIGFYRETNAKTEHSGTIWGVYMRPSLRKQGIGKKLMGAIMQHIQHCAGLTLVTLSVVTDNEAAIKLYESFGFVIWGTQADALHVDNQSYAMHWMSYQIPQS